MSALKLETYMSWVPLLGSALGSLVGGFISDYLVKTRSCLPTSSTNSTSSSERSSHSKALLPNMDSSHHSQDGSSSSLLSQKQAGNNMSMRMLVAGMGNLLALPVIVYSLIAGFPTCFLLMLVSGLVSAVLFILCLFLSCV